MDERSCIRGCTHDDGQPREALDGSYLCARCSRRLRHTITEAPDLCVRIRSSIDPMKSGWNFTQGQPTNGARPVKRPASDSRPPMSLDAIEAADEVYAILTYFAEMFGDEMQYRLHTFEAGVDVVDAYHQAQFPANYLLSVMDGILNDIRVEEFARAVLGPREKVFVDGELVEPWTIARALRRWPDYERDRMSTTPCPECHMRTVKMRLPRIFGQPTLLRCISVECGWEPPRDEQTLWMEAFGIQAHVHSWEHLPEMPKGELSCSCGSSAVEIEQGWDVIRDDGLVVIADVDIVTAGEQSKWLNSASHAHRYRVRTDGVPDGLRIIHEEAVA